MHELTKWGTTLAALIGFALAMGLNPALYGATADVLARQQRALPRVAWMVAGLSFGATVLFLIFQSFSPTSFVTLLKHDIDSALVNRTVDLAVGIVLLLTAAVLAAWKLRVPTRPVKPPKAPGSDARTLVYFGIGISSSVIGFTTLPIMYLTGQLVTRLSPHLALRALAYIVFLLALGAPYFTLVWLWRRFPPGFRGGLSAVRAGAALGLSWAARDPPRSRRYRLHHLRRRHPGRTCLARRSCTHVVTQGPVPRQCPLICSALCTHNT